MLHLGRGRRGADKIPVGLRHLACPDGASDHGGEAGHDHRPYQPRALHPQRRHRLVRARVGNVRRVVPRSRQALRDGGGVDHHHQETVDRGTGIRFRRRVLPNQEGHHAAEGDSGAASGRDVRRRLARRPRVHGAIRRCRLHRARGARPRQHARAGRRAPQICLGRARPRHQGLDQRLHLPGRDRERGARLLPLLHFRKGRLASGRESGVGHGHHLAILRAQRAGKARRSISWPAGTVIR